ncbi:MAG: 2-succinyl-6-hydroxy-2,4-cyclohexadiene-1-carboxylate synthase [Gemmatimonadota bacterium]
MLLLHGFTGSAASWPGTLVDGLASRERLPVLVDLPGHGAHAGDTDPAHFALAPTLESLVRAQGPEPGPVVGYSMGGRLALAFAVAHPRRVTRLVLESASPGLATEEERAARREADETLARRLETRGIEAFVDAWEELPLFESQRALPPRIRAAQRARRLRNDPRSLAESLRGVGTGSLPSYWEALDRLSIPVLLLTGALDRKFTEIAREMARRLPDVRHVVVPGAGHAVHLERPHAWLSAVCGFLA